MASCLLRSSVLLQSSLYLVGGLVLAVGAGLVGSAEFLPWRDSELGRLAVAGCVLGGLLLLLGVLGVLSSSCSSCPCCPPSCLAYTFSVFLLVLVIGQILACLLLLLLSPQVAGLTGRVLQETMPFYNTSSSDPLHYVVTKAWDSGQSSLQCCGVNSPSQDWGTYGHLVSPPSCPPDPTQSTTTVSSLLLPAHQLLTSTTSPPPTPTPSCMLALRILLARHSVPVLALLAGLLGFQVLVLCLSCCLARLHQSRECSGAYSP